MKILKTCLLFLAIPLLAFAQYDLSLCAIFQNEAPYLKEWIDFHKLVGVQHFYLYNNNSTDNYKEVLQPYVESGELELFEWNLNYTHIDGWANIQHSAYQDAVLRATHVSKWLVIIDTDEFIFPVEKDSLMDFLRDYEPYAAVCANWQMFGTSCVPYLFPGESMLEKLTYKANWNFRAHRHVKSIVRPECVQDITNPHYVNLKIGYCQVTENKLPFDGAETPYTSINKIRINHYWTRDEYFLLNNKIPRRKYWPGSIEAILMEASHMNEVYDDLILQKFLRK